MSEATENCENAGPKTEGVTEAKTENVDVKVEAKADEKTEEQKLLEKSKAEAEDFKNKYYYALAELDNARKRFDRERQNFIKYGNEKILKDLIAVVDNLDRTVDSVTDQDEKVQNIVNGVKMIRKQFCDVLNVNGLEPVESLGKDFDPNFHEALAQQKLEGKKEGEIIMEYQKGYLLNGRLLRAAKVIVAKNND